MTEEKQTENFRKLNAWQKAHVLTLEVYRTTKSFPGDERFGITSQMQRAAYSVPANIAEGSKRKTASDKAHFLTIAIGSLEELKYFLILTHDLGYLSEGKKEELYDVAREVSGMLHKLRSTLHSS